MDITTLIGIIAGFALIVTAIFIGGGGTTFIHLPSFMITIGGMVCATLINFPKDKLLLTGKVIRTVILHKLPSPDDIIEKIVLFIRIAHKDGILELDKHFKTIDYFFFRKGIRLAIDGVRADVIADILNKELMVSIERHKVGYKILRAMGAYAPAFGMIGTLIGLIQMLRTLEDPSQIGSGMALALLTTFYGALMANLVFLPMAGKVKERTEEEKLLRMLIIEGISAMLSEESPRIIEERLLIFLNPVDRQVFLNKRRKGLYDT
ncbi:MAG: MotA/TolQ/ExbB proton channel family protein [Candidatus Omnitrophica bacterium]|nr:MotA/TolQ/ExbB proton channel family protein [Candidatus Omnitrophota bacterium]